MNEVILEAFCDELEKIGASKTRTLQRMILPAMEAAERKGKKKATGSFFGFLKKKPKVEPPPFEYGRHGQIVRVNV